MPIQKITAPRLTLLARPEFLAPAHVNVAWLGEASGGERLAEFAGRNCYQSWDNPSGRTTGEYLENIRKQGHGCYDGTTDVLTADGWKAWPDVTTADALATRTASGVIEYHRPTRLVAYEYAGPMYRVEARHVDLLVTPDHRMLACLTTTRAGRRKEAFSLLRADVIGERAHAYVKTGTWDAPAAPWAQAEPVATFALLGFVIGDGSVVPSGRQAKFHLRRERKITWLRRMAVDAGWALKSAPAGHGRYTLTAPEHLADLMGGVVGADRVKQIPQHLLTALDKPRLLALLDGLMESDGHRGRTGDSFDTTSARLADQVQQLCLHAGRAANVAYTYGPEQRPTSFGERPLTRLSILSRSLTPEVNRFAGSRARSAWIDNWRGMVYCAEVPNHTLYVRRNGVPVWSGNSVYEHAHYSVLVEGVSRSLSHEVVRHRVFNYSQLSQRYVDESETEFVVPPAYLDLRESVYGVSEVEENWWCHCLSSVRAYRTLVDQTIGNFSHLPKRDARIKAREAARSVLPNATETKIVVTGNARGWRALLELRGAEGAEREVRRLAVALFALLRGEAEGFFADGEVYAGADGHPALRFAHHKI